MRRVILATLLLSILASCRILCATSACDHSAEASTPRDGGEQVPHQVNDDHCLCNGGIQADDAGAVLAGLDPLLCWVPAILPADPLVGWLAVEPPRSPDGPNDRRGRHGPWSKLRAQLGTYRC